MKRNNQGFTLVELLVATVVGALVMAAATTVILLGIRINNKANDTAKNQFTTRTLMTLLEDLSSEGKITKVTSGTSGWVILVKAEDDGTNRVALYYDAAEQTIFTGGETGEGGQPASGGTPIMKGVYASYVTMADRLLTFSMETEQGTFASTLNCRTANGWLDDNTTDATVPSISGTPTTQREEFLKALSSQYAEGKVNKGQIVDPETGKIGKYYAQWYLETKYPGQENQWNNGTSGWDADTPWCVCFISWGLAQSGLSNPPFYANVDEFWKDIQDNTKNIGTWKEREVEGAVTTPAAGDLVFFDWIVNGTADPQHIGAVLKVDTENHCIYTIEGNSAGIVAVRKYALDDPRILGYGIIFS